LSGFSSVPDDSLLIESIFPTWTVISPSLGILTEFTPLTDVISNRYLLIFHILGQSTTATLFSKSNFNMLINFGCRSECGIRTHRKLIQPSYSLSALS
jgi:hypothetical protein